MSTKRPIPRWAKRIRHHRPHTATLIGAGTALLGAATLALTLARHRWRQRGKTPPADDTSQPHRRIDDASQCPAADANDGPTPTSTVE